jgi:hypothetical protein
VASRPRALLAPLAALVAALFVAGCVSMPSAGPVLSYPVAQQTGGQNGQNLLQIIAAPPGNGWGPKSIVTGFLTAAAAIGGQQRVAREYLTPQASKIWNPSWNAFVYQTGPTVMNPVYRPTSVQPSAGPHQSAGVKPTAKSVAKGSKPPPELAIVMVHGKISASLSGHGTYAVPSSSAPDGPQFFELVQTGGQWRISSAPSELLLTQVQFAADYELRNLYFFDPSETFLVPDPVYVPLQATTTSLMDRLVNDLIAPPDDWLAGGATQTSFPPGTKIIGGITLSGSTAAVNLGGSIARAQDQKTLLAQVSAQLLWTLVVPGQGGSQVQSVELLVNGQPKYPPGNSQGIPVQHVSESSYQPPTGASSVFYYVSSVGYLYSRNDVTGKQRRIAKIGTGYTRIAVSPDGRYLGALSQGSLYMGPIDGPLVKQQGPPGYMTISWDPTDNLWATTEQGEILAFRAGVSPNSREARPLTATVPASTITVGQITAAQIAPDGVRVALLISGELTFGAIVWQQGAGTGPGLGSVKIELSPFDVSDPMSSEFTAVTWYGPDNVITLGGPGSTLTDYPVNGGTSTEQSLDESVESITASSGQALVAGLARGAMIQAPTLTGAWTPIADKGVPPVYPG